MRPFEAPSFSTSKSWWLFSAMMACFLSVNWRKNALKTRLTNFSSSTSNYWPEFIFFLYPVSRNFWVGLWWFYEFLKATQALSDYNFKIRIIVMVVDGRNAKVISNLQQQHYGIWFFWLATKHFLHHTHNALILYFMTFSKHQMLSRGVQMITKYVVNWKRKVPLMHFFMKTKN